MRHRLRCGFAAGIAAPAATRIAATTAAPTTARIRIGVAAAAAPAAAAAFAAATAPSAPAPAISLGQNDLRRLGSRNRFHRANLGSDFLRSRLRRHRQHGQTSRQRGQTS